MINFITYQRPNLLLGRYPSSLKIGFKLNENYEMCMKGRSSLLHSTSSEGVPYTPMKFSFHDREMGK